MEAKKEYFMDRLIDKSLTRLFFLADYVCDHILFVDRVTTVATPQPAIPTISAATKSSSTSSAPPIPPIRFINSDHVVEGELFG